MALGNNRDYKTTDRRARKSLERHGMLMASLIARGFIRDEASRIAMAFMEGVECPVCHFAKLKCTCFSRVAQ